jgi:hypothetical protein
MIANRGVGLNLWFCEDQRFSGTLFIFITPHNFNHVLVSAFMVSAFIVPDIGVDRR